MNVAQARPRTWTPPIILFSILLHAAVIYYVAVAFNIVPPLSPPNDEPPAVQIERLPPLPPVITEPPPKIERRPLFQQRQPNTPPVAPLVPPSPLPPTANPVTTGPAAIDVRQPIQEQPVAQLLPTYPRDAIEREIQGKVLLSITIMPDGSVRDVRVVSARPPGYFENAAINAVLRWRYKPSNMIRTNVIVDIDFVLQ